MAANLGRWLKYAQAKLNSAVSSSNAELDELEAEQRAAAEDKPWLSSDGDAPTLEETRTRIEWEAEDQRRRAQAAPAPPSAPTTGGTGAPASPAAPNSGGIELDPADPDVAAARVELDRQARESRERLEAIRKELGVDAPGDGPPSA